jgi:dihydrofolate reductase
VGFQADRDEVTARLAAAGIPGVAGDHDATVAHHYTQCGCRSENPRQEARAHERLSWTLANVSETTRAAQMRVPCDIGAAGAASSLAAIGGGACGAAFYLADDRSSARRQPDEEHIVRPLRYSINVTLDGCCDHRAILPDAELHQHAAENLGRADALLFGRVTYAMMEEAFRPAWTGGMPAWMEPFRDTIDAARKFVVSGTLERVDWNAELLRGDLRTAVLRLKGQDGHGLLVGGVRLPLALAEMGLIDEYEFVVHPAIAGHGPALLAGLSRRLDLRPVGRREFASGAVAMRFVPAPAQQ